MCIYYVRNVINGGHFGFSLNKCNIFVLNKTYVLSNHKKYKFGHQKVISNMIEKEDNAENKIHHVISAAILKKVNLVTFPKEIFGKCFFSLKYMS